MIDFELGNITYNLFTVYNWVEVKTKMWSMNLGKPVVVPQLNEAMATELGANLLGEAIIFGIGAGLLIWEYVRSSNKEAKKEEALQTEKENLYNTLSDLQFRVEKQEAQIRSLTRHIADLGINQITNHKKTYSVDGVEILE